VLVLTVATVVVPKAEVSTNTALMFGVRVFVVPYGRSMRIGVAGGAGKDFNPEQFGVQVLTCGGLISYLI
jgi:hypothetical protein